MESRDNTAGKEGMQEKVYDTPLIYDEELYEHKAKTGISKYDLIKVKIMSGTGDSYSILSRLIIYRMLTCIGVK